MYHGEGIIIRASWTRDRVFVYIKKVPESLGVDPLVMYVNHICIYAHISHIYTYVDIYATYIKIST